VRARNEKEKTLSDKLAKKIREAEDEVAAEIESSRLEEFAAENQNRALFILGGVTVTNRLADALGSEAIKTLLRFQDEQLYLALGYSKMVDFLSESEFAPMSKQQFYDRKALLEKEGEQLFDMLTELGISIRKRKLLGKGNIEVSGDTLIVHNGDESTEIAINDRASILEALTALADANAEKTVKLTVQQERIDKHDDKVRELHAENDRIRAAKIADFAADAHMTARVELGLAFSKFTDIVSKLSDIEKNQFRNDVLEDIAGWSASLRNAYQCGSPHGSKGVTEDAIVGDSLEEAFDNFLDIVDLDDAGNNDGELADQL